MDIKNKPTLAEKQAFWAEQLPNFESKYWLPSHFELLEFDMEGGNYEVRDVLPEHYSEDDATEIWHRVNTGWAMWKKAINFTKAQAVPECITDIQSWIAKHSFSVLDICIFDFPAVDANELAEFIASLNINVAVPEGFVLVPKLLSDELADELAIDAFNNIQSMFDYEHRGSTATHREEIRLRWCKNKARDFQENYKAMIEAQEQSHD